VIPGGIGPTNATNNNSSSSNSNRRWISLALVMAAVLSAVAFRPRNNFLASFDAKSRGGSPPLLRRRESLETAFSEPHRTPYLERRGLDESVVDEWLGANTSCDLDYCQSSFNATTLCPGATFEEAGFLQKIPMWVQIVFLLVLLTFSALFSGLTLGLMSLDITGLEIVMAGDDPNAIKYAKKIYPLRKQGNLLLCTLLLGNVAVNSLMAIFSAQIFDGTIGFLASTISIVIFGEIIPQALVSSIQCGWLFSFSFLLPSRIVSSTWSRNSISQNSSLVLLLCRISLFGSFVPTSSVLSIRAKNRECHRSDCEGDQIRALCFFLAAGKGPGSRPRTGIGHHL
jgi:hypothetical protein